MNRTEYKSVVGHFRRETRNLPQFGADGMLTPMQHIFVEVGGRKAMVYRHVGELASAVTVRDSSDHIACVLVGLMSHETLFKDKLTRKSLLALSRGSACGKRVPIPG